MNDEEKYICFSKEIEVGFYRIKEGKEVRIKYEIRFIDSFKFMVLYFVKFILNVVLCGKCELCKLGDCWSVIEKKGRLFNGKVLDYVLSV